MDHAKMDGGNTELQEPIVRRDAWMFRPLHLGELHLFDHRGETILYDVSGGAFFQIDQVVQDILEAADNRTVVEVLEILQARWPEKEIVSTYKELYESEVVSDLPVTSRPFTPPGRLEIVHLGLDVTYDSLGTRDPFSRDPELCPPSDYMSEEVAHRAIDLLLAESGHVRRCQVTFQGGDPLLNPNLLASVIAYGREEAEKLGKEIVFQVRGSRQFLNERALRELRRIDADIVVDVEDPAEIPGELPLFHGHGPFSLSPADLQQLNADSGTRLHLRQVRQTSTDLDKHLGNLLERYPSARTVTLSVESNHAEGITEEAQEASLQAYADRVRTHVTSGGTAWIGDFEDAISQVFNQKDSMYHCGAGTRYITVSPDGGIYVCPGLVRNEAFRIGSVADGIDRMSQRTWIKQTHVEKFSSCSTCWARYLCGGGCKLEAFQDNGDIRRPNESTCRRIRRTYELAMGTCLDIASTDETRLHDRYAEAG